LNNEYRNTETRLPAPTGFSVRREVQREDTGQVVALVSAAGNFSTAEIGIACELVEERLAKGEASGYEFVFLESSARELAGYTCYGPIAGTDRRFDLYWIAVHPRWQGHGLGRWLMAHTEQEIRSRGGVKVYIETSSRDGYSAARTLYQRCGYRLDARLEDFYAAGDANCIFSKVLHP
jgi:ribosomal protein S18 acetylase RimI-like enzyme